MEVLILSKTAFGKSVCVGGMVLSNNQYVRVLNPGGYYQYADTKFNIGDIWDLKFVQAPIIEPHNEDVTLLSQRYLRRIDNITDYILSSGANIWRGRIENIFENKLRWTQKGSGYLSSLENDNPSHSVGFWISDQPLNFVDDHYVYPTGNILNRGIKYKGLPAAIDVIPANTLIRVSLAKWWAPEDSDAEKRCFAQLSGWY